MLYHVGCTEQLVIIVQRQDLWSLQHQMDQSWFDGNWRLGEAKGRGGFQGAPNAK